MWGRESEQLENLRRQKRVQYAADLQQQMNDKNGISTFKSTAVQQIVGIRQTDEPRTPEPQYAESARSGYEMGNQKMQYMMDRMFAIEFPLKIKPCQEAINNLSSKLETITNSNQIFLSSMKDKITEMAYNINSINEKAFENKEKIQQMISELHQENTKTREYAEHTAAQVSNLENRFNQLEDSVRSMMQRQQQFEQIVSEQMTKLNQNIANVSQTSSENEQILASQMESLNRQTQATFGVIGQQIQTVSSIMSDSITQLATSTKEGLEIVRSDNDEVVAALERQIEQSTAETATAISVLEDEVTKTVQSAVNMITNVASSVETALLNENGIRKRNEQKIIDSYDVFTVTIAGQLATNTKTIDKIEANVKVHVEQLCASFLSTWKNDLSSFLKDVSITVGDCQSRTLNMEQRLSEYIVSVGKRQDEIISLIDKSAFNVHTDKIRQVPAPQNYTKQEIHIPTVAKPAATPQKSIKVFRPPIVKRPAAPIPQINEQVVAPAHPNMVIRENDTIFHRDAISITAYAPVKVLIAEPRTSKRYTGMVLAPHGKFHSGRPKNKEPQPEQQPETTMPHAVQEQEALPLGEDLPEQAVSELEEVTIPETYDQSADDLGIPRVTVPIWPPPDCDDQMMELAMFNDTEPSLAEIPLLNDVAPHEPEGPGGLHAPRRR